MSRPTDESSIGVIFWIVLIIEVNATWILMDLWLHAHRHELLTVEFREALQRPIAGFLLAFLTFGTFAGAIWHFFIQKN